MNLHKLIIYSQRLESWTNSTNLFGVKAPKLRGFCCVTTGEEGEEIYYMELGRWQWCLCEFQKWWIWQILHLKFLSKHLSFQNIPNEKGETKMKHLIIFSTKRQRVFCLSLKENEVEDGQM